MSDERYCFDRRGNRYVNHDGQWKPCPETPAELAAGRRRIREMVESGRTPAIGGTNHSFMQGYDNNQQLDELDKHTRQAYLDSAEEAGVSIHGKRYCTGLARDETPCDPLAWVGDEHEFAAKCRAQGKGSTGAVNVTY